MYLLFFSLLLLAAPALGVTVSKRPSNYPQTTFSYGSVQPGKGRYINGKTGAIDAEGSFKGASTYQFDIEIPSLDFFSIGFNGKVFIATASSAERIRATGPVFDHFYLGLGGFWRLHYPLLSSLEGFGRVDLGIGPFLGAVTGVLDSGSATMEGGGGMMGEFGLQLGMDYSFSQWFALTAAYNKSFYYGLETLAGNIRSQDPHSTKGRQRVSLSADAILIGLKTTYL